MEFTYEGFVRQAFGFQNPNHAAALFAALLPVCWGLRALFEGRRWRYAVMPVELALYLALVLTYSRAGLAALLSAALLFYALRSNFSGKAFLERAKSALRRPSLWISAAVLLGGALCFGAFKRYVLWIFVHDSSVGNRFELWHGALRMIAENPQGVGLGESGRVYTFFYQPEGVNLAYRTLVNSFLTFVAENGLLASGLALALPLSAAGLALFALKRLGDGTRIAVISALSALLSLAVSGMLSTCLDLTEPLKLLYGAGDLNAIMQSSLFLIALAALILLLTASWPASNGRRLCLAALSGFSLSCALVLGVYCAGALSVQDDMIQCRISSGPNGARWAFLKDRSEADAKRCAIVPDEKAVGVRELMRILRSKPKGREFAIPLSDQAALAWTGARQVVLCGRKASAAWELDNVDIILFRPTVICPKDALPKRVKAVCLDKSDEYGVNRSWRNAADLDFIPVEYVIPFPSGEGVFPPYDWDR